MLDMMTDIVAIDFLTSCFRLQTVVYNTAIEAARSSKFVHEEGLACELAGMHYKRIKDVERALSLFQRALECYDEWGSQMKVRMMQEKIQHLCSQP